MAAHRLRSARWAQQPPGLARPSQWALDRGLIALVVPTHNVELVNQRPFTLVGAPTTEAQAGNGVALRTNGSSTAMYAPIVRRTVNEFSLFAVQQAISAGTDTRSLSLGDSLSDQTLCMLNTGAVTASRLRLFIRNNAGANAVVDGTSISPYDGGTHAIGFSYSSTLGGAGYSDGIADVQSLPGGYSGFVFDQVAVGCLRRTGNGSFWSGRTWLGAAFVGFLTADDHARIAGDPWGMLVAPRSIWMPVAASIPPSFSAAWARSSQAIIGSGVR